jgi:hypothetical protein
MSGAPGRIILAVGPIDIDDAAASAPPLLVGAPPLTTFYGAAHAFARTLHQKGIPAFPEAVAFAVAARSSLRILSRRGRSTDRKPKPIPYGDARIDLRLSWLMAYGSPTSAQGGWSASNDAMAEALETAAGCAASFWRGRVMRGVPASIPRARAVRWRDVFEDRPLWRSLHGLRFIASVEEDAASPDAPPWHRDPVPGHWTLPTVVGYVPGPAIDSPGPRSAAADPHQGAALAEPLYGRICLRSAWRTRKDQSMDVWWRVCRESYESHRIHRLRT